MWSKIDTDLTLGTEGSEKGTIIKDEEYNAGARITLEKDAGGIPFALEALSAEEESIRKLALQSIQGWLFVFNRSFVQVSKQQKDQIQILIEKQKEKLSANLIRELLFLLN